MKLKNVYLSLVKYLLPSPFTIAILLTLATFILAFLLTSPTEANYSFGLGLLGYWEKGIWELLAFSMQMVLILVLGHALALTPLLNLLIKKSVYYCTSTAKSAFIISFLSILISFFNWGLCLIVGAILARKVAENASEKGIKINYPIIGAAGYSGLMTWHGGFSGSAPLTVSGKNHFLIDTIGQIGISETILSPMNMSASFAIMIIIPITFYLLGKKSAPKNHQFIPTIDLNRLENKTKPLEGAEKLDHSYLLAKATGLAIVSYTIYKGFTYSSSVGINFINLNYINLLLFGLGLLLHQSFNKFILAVTEAIGGTTGIILQFPLYAGIMGIMKYSGLIHTFSNVFISISTPDTLPLFTMVSAAVVNTFVPSGGGQWAVQGPIVVEAAISLKTPINKIVMALSYGDQLTNMIQPFWALPLLGITQLKAKEILPYSFIVMFIGGAVFMTILWLF